MGASSADQSKQAKSEKCLPKTAQYEAEGCEFASFGHLRRIMEMLRRDNTKRKDGEGTAMTPKAERHVKKRMLCIFWTVHGPIHWELLKPGATVTSNIYCEQHINNVMYLFQLFCGIFNFFLQKFSEFH